MRSACEVAAAELRKEVDARHAKVSWYEELFQDRYSVFFCGVPGGLANSARLPAWQS